GVARFGIQNGQLRVLKTRTQRVTANETRSQLRVRQTIQPRQTFAFAEHVERRRDQRLSRRTDFCPTDKAIAEKSKRRIIQQKLRAAIGGDARSGLRTQRRACSGKELYGNVRWAPSIVAHKNLGPILRYAFGVQVAFDPAQIREGILLARAESANGCRIFIIVRLERG